MGLTTSVVVNSYDKAPSIVRTADVDLGKKLERLLSRDRRTSHLTPNPKDCLPAEEGRFVW
jgi:hypothetical protein